MTTLTAKSLKCGVVLEPAEVGRLSAPLGQPRVPITIQVASRAQLNAKSVRKCIVTISEAGPDNCVAVLQSKLAGDVVEDAGLAIQIKAPRLAVEAELLPDMGELFRVCEPSVGHHHPQCLQPGLGEEQPGEARRGVEPHQITFQ